MQAALSQPVCNRCGVLFNPPGFVDDKHICVSAAFIEQEVRSCPHQVRIALHRGHILDQHRASMRCRIKLDLAVDEIFDLLTVQRRNHYLPPRIESNDSWQVRQKNTRLNFRHLPCTEILFVSH